MDDGNNLELNYSQNPELKEIFSRKEVGEECTLEVTFTVSSKDDNGVKGAIKSIAPCDEEGEDDADPKSVEPDAKEPAMLLMKSAKEDDAEAPTEA